MTTIDKHAAAFLEEPGYLDFARVGPIGRAVKDEQYAQGGLHGRARFGTLEGMGDEHERLRNAVAETTGLRADQIIFQPNTSQGLMHAMFGITGGVALSAAEFPSLTFAAMRSAQALGVLNPVWLTTDHGRVTPGNLREQLTSSVDAVALSLVDARTGFTADLEGIREVIGDRLLIVDAIQGFGAIDAPWECADVIASGGQKWVRAGAGTGFLAMSDRAVERLTPVISGFNATDTFLPFDEVPAPSKSVNAFQVTYGDPFAQARFSAALEEINHVGVSAIAERLAEKVDQVLDLADEFGLPVVSPRESSDRAGIVVVEPHADHLTVLTASLFNHGVTVTVRGAGVRISPHVSTDEESFDMLRASFASYASATRV